MWMHKLIALAAYLCLAALSSKLLIVWHERLQDDSFYIGVPAWSASAVGMLAALFSSSQQKTRGIICGATAILSLIVLSAVFGTPLSSSIAEFGATLCVGLALCSMLLGLFVIIERTSGGLARISMSQSLPKYRRHAAFGLLSVVIWLPLVCGSTAVIFAAVWWLRDPGWEPVITFFAGASTLLDRATAWARGVLAEVSNSSPQDQSISTNETEQNGYRQRLE